VEGTERETKHSAASYFKL